MTNFFLWLFGSLSIIGWLAFAFLFSAYKQVVSDYYRLERKCIALLRAAEGEE